MVKVGWLSSPRPFWTPFFEWIFSLIERRHCSYDWTLKQMRSGENWIYLLVITVWVSKGICNLSLDFFEEGKKEEEEEGKKEGQKETSFHFGLIHYLFGLSGNWFPTTKPQSKFNTHLLRSFFHENLISPINKIKKKHQIFWVKMRQFFDQGQRGMS